MRITIYTLLLFFCSCLARGQNYQCLQSGEKHYFTNNIGYLRGIRIDSVKTFPDSTIYFPYKTQRGEYYTGTSTLYDGGSWLGGKVIELTDGTLLVDNIWKDTVIIKTHAQLGDSWIFYQDSTDIYFKADVISKTVRTIYGVPDSVKTIRIRAFNRDTGLIPSDPANDLRITLSKNHGFYEVFDLYLFPHNYISPYYSSGTTDYFFFQCDSQQFRLVDLYYPRGDELYDYNVGDMYEYYGDCYPYPCHHYTSDKYIAREAVGLDQIKYTVKRTEAFYYSYPKSPEFLNTIRTFTVSTSITNPIDTSLMPEEKGNENLYHYFPGDSSHCIVGVTWKITRGILFNDSEPCGSSGTLKLGLGLISSYQCSEPTPGNSSYSRLIYYNKNGTGCGSYVNIPNQATSLLLTPPTINISPNPADEQLTVSFSSSGKYSIAIVNLLGRQVFASESDKVTTTINTSQLPAGLYIINIRDNDGNTTVQKISITH